MLKRFLCCLMLVTLLASAQALSTLNLRVLWDDGSPVTGGLTITDLTSGANVLGVSLTSGSYRGQLQLNPADTYSAALNFSDASGNPQQLSALQLPTGNAASEIAFLANQQINLTIARATNQLAGAPTLTALFIPVFANTDGGAYTDSLGNVWTATPCPPSSHTYSASHSIANTPDQAIYKKECWGAMTFTLPVTNGAHVVTLKFAELYWNGPGQRLFNVAVNGQPMLSNFDIFKAAGGAFIANDQTFPVNVTTGQIVLSFTNGAADNAKIDAISIQ